MHYLSTMKVPSHFLLVQKSRVHYFYNKLCEGCSVFDWGVGGIGFWFLMLFCFSNEPYHNLELWM